MSRIDELIAELCPTGVSFEPLRDVGVWYGGGTPSKQEPEYWQDGTLPWLSPKDMRKPIVEATEDYITESAVASSATRVVPANSVAVVVRSSILDRTLPTALVPVPITLNQDMKAVVARDGILPSYIAHLLRSLGPDLLRTVRKTGGSVASIDTPRLMAVRVPVPPLEVQRAIVRVLGTFAELEMSLEAELEARRTQYAFYLDSLLSFSQGGVHWMTLGEVGKISMCKRVFKSETSPTGEIPFYKIGTFGGEPDAYISRDLYESYRDRYPFPKYGDVLLSAAGTIGRAIPYDGRPAYFQDSNIVWIDNDESIVKNAYLRYWYRVIEWTTDGGIIRRLYNGNIRRARIAVPSLAEQERIVAILDKFDTLVNDRSVGLPAELSARRQQYEHYRDGLLSFAEAA